MTLDLGNVEFQPFVVLFGTPENGFAIVGPFNSYQEADEYLKTDPEGKTNAWVVAMDQPNGEDDQ